MIQFVFPTKGNCIRWTPKIYTELAYLSNLCYFTGLLAYLSSLSPEDSENLLKGDDK